MADEPESIEELVIRIFRVQVAEGRWERLIEARQWIGTTISPRTAELAIQTLEASAEVTRRGPLAGHGELEAKTVAPTAELVGVVESVAPELANAIKERSPQERMSAANLWWTFWQILGALLTLYAMSHHEPPTQQQINEFCNRAINCVIYMPPPGHS